MQAPHAAVGGIGPALQETPRFQTINEPSNGNWLDLDESSEFVLGDPGLPIEVDQDHPLGAGHSKGTGSRVGARPHKASNDGDEDQGIAVDFFHNVGEYKQRYYFCNCEERCSQRIRELKS